ncbi:MAG: NUDIX hydrolase [Roseibium sp.]|nr:NUDIX hydrolase [Roseibium sp.]
MTSMDTTLAPTASWLQTLKGLFIRPTRLQVAALCHRSASGEPDVLLVTSRDKGRWILPKGWPEPDLEAHETAALEAFEEAGVRGDVDQTMYGSFRSHKGMANGSKIPTRVLVYRIAFGEQVETFREKGQRQVVWMSVSRAIETADEPGLRRLLKRFRADMRRSAAI